MLLGLYRESADVVIVGASTVRRERVPTPRTSVLALVTSSGHLAGHKLELRDNHRVVVVTSPTGAARVASDLAKIPHRSVVLDKQANFLAPDILGALSGLCSTHHVLIEGGRVLWETFAPITDELALAVTPPPLDYHGGIPPWWPGDTSRWTVHSLMTDDEKMLYYRYITHIRGES
jgi:riboflavin biosynthesis pyrimidine reductase